MKKTWRKPLAHVWCVPFPKQASKVEIFYSRVSHSAWRKFYFKHDAALKAALLITERSVFSLQHFPKQKEKWTPSFYLSVCYLKIWRSRSSCLSCPSSSFALKWKVFCFLFFVFTESFFLSHSVGWAVRPEMWPLHKGSAFPLDGFVRARSHKVVQTGLSSYTSFRRNLDTTKVTSSTVSRGWFATMSCSVTTVINTVTLPTTSPKHWLPCPENFTWSSVHWVLAICQGLCWVVIYSFLEVPIISASNKAKIQRWKGQERRQHRSTTVLLYAAGPVTRLPAAPGRAAGTKCPWYLLIVRSHRHPAFPGVLDDHVTCL